MSTPEGPPKNYIPTGINKSLLTPCRRVGLSRSKKTPIDLLGLSKQDTSTTLKNKETYMLNIPEITGTLIKPHLVDTQTEDEHKIPQSNNKKIMKGTLNLQANEGFNVAAAKTISYLKEEKSASVKKENVNKKAKLEHQQINKEEIETLLESEVKLDNRKNIKAVEDTDCEGNKVNQKIKFSEKNSLICSVINNKDKPILRHLNSNLSDECLLITRKKRKFLDSDDRDDKKSLTKFTTEEYLTENSTCLQSFTKNLTVENDDLIGFAIGSTMNKGIKKKYVAINCPLISTKNDNTNETQISTKKIKVETNIGTKISCDIKQKSKKFQKQISSKFDTEESDDDMFTPSPQSYENQKENLLKRIIEMKDIVKQKEETLEKMKRAQIYKDKHSPLEVKKSTDVWKIACEKSLKDLHLKMQEHGPIEMNNLIKKIGIPDYIVKDLKLD
ncbi:flap endonuclease 1-like [Euwallacea similis]|uniref:flap endonuclease 1-like n=1 Tax=Euwallacea similis TaxID=1736056 RepID=UPI00344D57E2